ncbi:cell surface protein [Jeotgalibacillus sp. JSM ZJ347]|uniref:cell surface protein n=1 Tax=Jeotgalibacillus sp. JSM ZJ347 TaxID=3342117 RepID=UPI0035A9ABD1
MLFSKVFKKSFFSLIVTLLFVGMISPAYSSAETVDSNSVENGLPMETINLADKYITVTNNKFVITDSEELKNEIGEKEFNIVENLVKENNELLKENWNPNIVKQGNKFTESVQNEASGQFTVQAVNASQYIDVDYTWWGMQVYFSSSAITDLNDFLAINGIVGGLGAADGIKSFLAKNGYKVTSKALGPVALFSGGVSWAMSKVDKGNGVNLNCVLYVPATITAA